MSDMLPRRVLHPSIVHKVYPTFLRGDYDTAVFQSFKEVEVAVRKAGGYTNADIGTNLMRKAFKPGDGPLSDSNSHPGEQQSLSDLFAGAIGCYKNPNSHRDVEIKAEDAVEMISLASHLLKIVDSRT